MRFSAPPAAVLLVLCSLACRETKTADPGEWPQFRGIGGSGVTAAVGLPESWSEDGAAITWKSPIPGLGNSSPIVSGDRIFLTSAEIDEAGEDRVERFALAVDLESGESLWQTSLGTAPAAKKHRLNTYAAATPVTDGSSLYVLFGDVLASLDREGEIEWRKEIDPEYAEYSHYGSASSLALTQDAVIVAQDKETSEKPEGWLAAFDKRTGNEIWRQSWSEACCSYTTPLVRQRGAIEEVIFVKAGEVISYDARDGRPLWQQTLEINQPVASPLMSGDLLVVFSGAHHVRHGAVMRLSGEGDQTEIEILWETKRMIPQTASPVLYNGRLYVVVSNGSMVCFDAMSGRPRWRQRLKGSGGFHASLVAGDGKVYATSNSGLVTVIDVREGYNHLASNQLEGGVNASPVFAGRDLLIRTASSLYRIRGQNEAAVAAKVEP